ncbi:hypothetical protein SEUCBS139899_005584 [Sporothrix eucalyptigena]|uniref:Uncharacterized protein n=1 Tax=Sporothrix eucalyptigena TaxID=1812306 RepID=A0ABP0C0Y8_9PEZI
MPILVPSFRACEGPAIFLEKYRPPNYVPSFVDTELGLQIVAPDTPYVARAGRSNLYFIDTRYDEKTAQHIKEQIELALVPDADTHTYIDDITATAYKRNGDTNKVLVQFDPVYARIFFAPTMNKHNPMLKLPEGGPDDGHFVRYNQNGIPKTMEEIEAEANMCCYPSQDTEKE